MLFRSDRKSTRLNSSHTIISYAVFCLKKKKTTQARRARGPPHPLTRTLGAPLRLPRPLGRRLRPGIPHQGAALGAARFFFNDTATTEIYTLSLHDALPI